MRAERARLLARFTAGALLLLVAAGGRAQVSDSALHAFALADELELQAGRLGQPVKIDSLGWIGGDVNRAWLRGELDQQTARSNGSTQLEAFYGRLLAPFWDALVGVRVDLAWGSASASLAHLAIGLQGLSPLRFELQPTLYLSQTGHVSFQLEAEYELYVTQRIVLQPRFETSAASATERAFEVGRGLGDLEFSARLRYELRREFAPYVGVAWHRRVGQTAALAREAGDYVSNVSVLIGVRAWR